MRSCWRTHLSWWRRFLRPPPIRRVAAGGGGGGRLRRQRRLCKDSGFASILGVALGEVCRTQSFSKHSGAPPSPAHWWSIGLMSLLNICTMVALSGSGLARPTHNFEENLTPRRAFVQDSTKHNKRNAFFVLERHNTINVLLFCPGAQKHSKRNAWLSWSANTQ